MNRSSSSSSPSHSSHFYSTTSSASSRSCGRGASTWNRSPFLPQLFMVSKTGRRSPSTSHYLFALGSYRGEFITYYLVNLCTVYKTLLLGVYLWLSSRPLLLCVNLCTVQYIYTSCAHRSVYPQLDLPLYNGGLLRPDSHLRWHPTNGPLL